MDAFGPVLTSIEHALDVVGSPQGRGHESFACARTMMLRY